LITRQKFEFVKEKYGYYSSSAEELDKPKSNIDDLSILDPDVNKELLSLLNPEVILEGRPEHKSNVICQETNKKTLEIALPENNY